MKKIREHFEIIRFKQDLEIQELIYASEEILAVAKQTSEETKAILNRSRKLLYHES